MHPRDRVREIRGATALITGSARRIGRAMALALAREEVNVVVHYRSSAAEAEELVDELKRTGVRAWSLQADLAKLTELNGLVDRAVDLAGGLRILVNNASAFPWSTFESVTRDDLVASIETDTWAPFELARQFARQADAAHVVNLLDTRIAAQFDWQHLAYCAAKDLLGMFTELMAIHLAPRIAVNAVAPGLILAPEGKDQAYLEALKAELPLRRIGDPASIAEALLFLLKSDFITGQTIFVDGGRHLLGGSRG
jgi:NAD(P)-dependent dehydrogenase (short-subunit alcohol dehydrogenase family)